MPTVNFTTVRIGHFGSDWITNPSQLSQQHFNGQNNRSTPQCIGSKVKAILLILPIGGAGSAGRVCTQPAKHYNHI